jgi:hypothetical protein
LVKLIRTDEKTKPPQQNLSAHLCRIGDRHLCQGFFAALTMKKLIYLLIGISIGYGANAQHKKAAAHKSAYKLYKNTRYHFSFEIPAGWKITSNGDGMDYTCYPVSKIEKAQYENYGYVFSLAVISVNLDSAAASIFRRGDDGEFYYEPA